MALMARGYDPFRDLENMASDMRKSMLHTFSQNGGGVGMPLADVYEEEGKYVVNLHVNGLKEDELDVELEHGTLVVKGEHKDSHEQKSKRNYVLRESSASIYRSFALPRHADTEKIAAHLEDGVLRLEIPLEQAKKPRKVSVKKNNK